MGGPKAAYKWLVAVAFVAGLFMDLMDATIVNVALPTLGRDFGASTDTLELVVTGYLISLAIWIPASGWISDRFGSKRTFAFALGFTIRTRRPQCRPPPGPEGFVRKGLCKIVFAL